MTPGQTITVAIPSIPPRQVLLHRALKSVSAQTHPVDGVSIAYDIGKEGAGPTRNRALEGVKTEWTCFIDDDDEMNPEHVEKILRCAIENNADVVYPWFDVIGGVDPFPGHFGKPWDPDNPRIFPITVIGRTELLQQATFPRPHDGEWAGDDYPFWLEVQALGGKIVHLPERTWKWHHHSRNTSGLPNRW